MAKRKRNRRKVNGFAFPAPYVSVVIMIAVFGLAYVWLGTRCEMLGREIKKEEAKRKILVKRYLNEEYRWSRIKSPRNLERVLQEHGIAMTWPRRDQVVRLYDTHDYTKGYAKLDRSVLNE
ncbi:hypothetical protein BVX97_03420 [bacterium E08(2017)]|nr:hypothetical protein BVX97_03420 [bacterium E08(2017)]